jgi:hypothetical protein
MRPMRVLFALLSVLLCVPAVALAHGDASTHYLENGNLYPGFSTQRLSQPDELALLGLLDAAQKAGYPIKVSVLGDVSDVSDRPTMFKHPQRYAEVIATDLKRSNITLSAPVIVVSPYGIGAAGPGAGRVDVPTGASGDQLGQASMAAVRELAQMGGHALPANVPPMKVPVVPPSKSSSGGNGYDLSGLTPFAVFIAIFGSAVLYVQIRTRMARRRPLRGA